MPVGAGPRSSQKGGPMLTKLLKLPAKTPWLVVTGDNHDPHPAEQGGTQWGCWDRLPADVDAL